MIAHAPFDVVARALNNTLDHFARHPSFGLGSATGLAISLETERWMGMPDAIEQRVLSRAVPPVLDVGCGPGRHTVALVQRGIGALGVDSAPWAVRLASRRGAPVLKGSVFDPVPGTGRWGTVLLLDGNVGIGGDPRSLLLRARRLLRPGGRVLVELDPVEPSSRSIVVKVVSDGLAAAGDWFAWAVVGPPALAELAEGTGFTVKELWGTGGRWFARLDSV